MLYDENLNMNYNYNVIVFVHISINNIMMLSYTIILLRPLYIIYVYDGHITHKNICTLNFLCLK